MYSPEEWDSVAIVIYFNKWVLDEHAGRSHSKPTLAKLRPSAICRFGLPQQPARQTGPAPSQAARAAGPTSTRRAPGSTRQPAEKDAQHRHEQTTTTIDADPIPDEPSTAAHARPVPHSRPARRTRHMQPPAPHPSLQSQRRLTRPRTRAPTAPEPPVGCRL